MDNYNSIMRNMLVQQLMHECRTSARQIALLEWNQIGDCKIRTRYGDREVKISRTTYNALMRIPVHGRFVFSASPLPPEEVLAPKMGENVSDKIERARAHFKAIKQPHLEFR